MNQSWRREYYLITIFPAVTVILLAGCFATTTQNPMKRPRPSDKIVRALKQTPNGSVAPVASGIAPVTSEVTEETTPYRLWRLLQAGRAALKAFREAMAGAEKEALDDFHRLIEEENKKRYRAPMTVWEKVPPRRTD